MATQIQPNFINLRANRTSPVSLSRQYHSLSELLGERLRGEVRFDAGARALYARDASNFRMVPIGIVLPKDTDDVVATLEICNRHRVPVLSRGGGTSLAGQCCNEAVVIDFTKHMGRVLELDAPHRRARVQPGAILDTLREEAAASGLTFGPDPATHSHCTLGGMLGNDSCGVHAVMSEFYGPGPRVHDNLHELEVVTYDGCRFRAGETSDEEYRRIIAAGGRRAQIYARLRTLRDVYAPLIRRRFPNIPRRVSGYNLPALLPENGFNVGRALVGSEGTCVTVLEATLQLIPSFASRCLLMVGYPSVGAAADAVTRVRGLEHKPIGCEGLDENLVNDIREKGLYSEHLSLLPEGKAWLIIQFGGSNAAEAKEQAEDAKARLVVDGAMSSQIYEDSDKREALWQIRESGLGATAFVPGQRDTWPGWEDSAVPPEQLGTYLRQLQHLFQRYGYQASLYGHFAQGCVHTRIPFNLRSEAGIQKYRNFTREAAELVVRLGGSLSGEHGDGQQRGELLPLMFGDVLTQAFREFKAIFDPDGLMNPGKLIDARSRSANLTLGTDYEVAQPETHFAFANDEHSIEHATLRCVGVGKCRRDDGEGLMCPSFMVLHEEEHSTRGRAHLLHEMLRGEVIKDGWKSEEVKEALDLCLSCKGCTHDCPVQVDIPTLKAEFLSHYYEGKLRSRSAYTIGQIHRWAKLGARVPSMANFVTQSPGLRGVAKWVAGIHQQRTIPRFAPRTFSSWFREIRRSSLGGPRVMLWPDTFNNHFHPETLAAAFDVLRTAGCDVVIPKRQLCCGRPLYAYGLLPQAKRLWQRVLDDLSDEIAQGTPMVGLEPSCTAAFRDELGNLFPDDTRAQTLRRQTFTLAEYLEQVPGYHAPKLSGENALVHFHCHHQGVVGTRSDRQLLENMGLSCEQPQKKCCGMAGAFGFEKEHYNLSCAVGERALLPEIRRAPAATWIIADGFSCRTQVEQLTNRRALHLAEALQLAQRRSQGHSPLTTPEALQEQMCPPELKRTGDAPKRRLAWAGLALAAAGVCAFAWVTRRRSALS